MEFTKQDKASLLKLYGGIQKTVDEDMEQLEEAADVTTYELCDADCRNVIRKISRATAIRRLGRENWLSGLVRSAFHSTAARETADGKNYILFDSSKVMR